MKRRNKKYSITVLIFVCFLLSSYYNVLALQINKEGAPEVYIIVDKNGNGDFTSIQKAIDYVPSGSTIYVKNGEYHEIVDINKPLSLVGEDKDATLISPISEKNKYAVGLGAQNIKISNFGIKNRAPGLYTTGIKITSSNIEISNCNLFDTPVGIALWGVSNIVIDQCEGWNCRDEVIACLGWKDKICEKNKITNCIFYDNCDGIELQYSSNNIIRNCEFYNNRAAIDAIGSNNDGNLFTGCIIKNNNYGIYLSSSSNNIIKNCEISGNKDGDIEMNKYSNNNQVISTNEQESTLENTQSTIKNFLGLFLKAKNSKILQLLSLID